MLKLKSGDQGGEEYPLQPGKVIIIGRAPSSTILLQDPSISKSHASVSINQDGAVILKDLNSLNGSTVNNYRLTDGASKQLRSGDRIYFGKVATYFDVIDHLHSSEQFRKKGISLSPDRIPSRDQPPRSSSVKKGLNSLQQKISLVNRPHFSQIDHLSSDQAPKIPPLHFPRSARGNDERAPQNSDINFHPFNRNITPKFSPETMLQSRKTEHQRYSPRRSLNKLGQKYQDQDIPPIERARELFQDQRQAIINNYEEKLKEMKENYEQQLFVYEQQKAKLGLRLNDIDRKLMEKEEGYLSLQERLQKSQNLQYDTNQENNKLKAKFKAVSLYASDLQHQVDGLKRDSFDKAQKLNELSDRDWTKRLIQTQSLIQQLRGQLLTKQNAINQLKKISNLSGNSSQEQQHYQSFIEQQSKQLQHCRKIISEFQQRENVCSRRWNAILQQNLKNAQLAASLNQQFKRQKDHYQNLITTSDRKLAQLNMRIPQMMQSLQKKQAAEFLVDQMQLLSDQRSGAVMENQKLHLLITQLSTENEHYKRKLESLGLNGGGGNMGGITTDNYYQIQQLYSKIQELRDVVHQLKEQGGSGRVVTLQSQIQGLNLQQAIKNKKVQELQHYAASLQKRADTSFDESQAIKFFQTALAERDEQINILKAQLTMISNNMGQIGVEKQDLLKQIALASAQNDRLKERQAQISEAAFGQGMNSLISQQQQQQQQQQPPPPPITSGIIGNVQNSGLLGGLNAPSPIGQSGDGKNQWIQ